MIQDAYVRQSQPSQRLYWSGPRTKWTNVNGLRTLPKLKRQLPSGLPDPKDKSGHTVYSWMVNREYVLSVLGDDGRNWCDRLLPNPPVNPLPNADSPLNVLRRPEFRDVKNLYDSWAKHLPVGDDASLPMMDSIKDQLTLWDQEMDVQE
jgi:hypothetical protein